MENHVHDTGFFNKFISSFSIISLVIDKIILILDNSIGNWSLTSDKWHWTLLEFYSWHFFAFLASCNILVSFCTPLLVYACDRIFLFFLFYVPLEFVLHTSANHKTILFHFLYPPFFIHAIQSPRLSLKFYRKAY